MMLCGIFDFGDAVGAAEVNFRRQTWPLEQEALQRRHASKPKQSVLVCRFNALRGGLDIKTARERERRRNNSSAFRTLCEVLSKRFVDLDLVKWKHQKLAQRRIAGPEVVKRNRYAEIFELAQNRQTFSC